MLISFFERSRLKKYLSKNANVLSFFSNNTLSLRREALYDIGIYDTHVARYSEDVDLCLRMHLSKWSMFHHKNILLKHRARPSFFKMLKQWWNYGWYSVKVHKRNTPNGIAEILLFNPKNYEDYFKEVKQHSILFFTDKAFVNASILLSIYFFSIFFFTVAILLWLLEIKILAFVFFVIAFSYFSIYIKKDFIKKPKFNFIKSIKLCFTRFSVNFIFMLASFISGLSSKAIYISGYIWNREE